MAKRKSQAIFDKFKYVKKVRQGESLRFRTPDGRLTKFDGRKKLIAEIWVTSTVTKGRKKKSISRRTDKVLNKTRKGRPVPEKFSPKLTKKRLLFLQHAKKGPRHAAEVKSKRITIDARHTIEDNLEIKIPEMAQDIQKWSRRGNGGYVTIEFQLRENETNLLKVEVINIVLKGNKNYVIKSVAAAIIARLYANLKRMSNISDSPLGKRGNYARSIKPRFTWTETKRLQDL